MFLLTGTTTRNVRTCLYPAIPHIPTHCRYERGGYDFPRRRFVMSFSGISGSGYLGPADGNGILMCRIGRSDEVDILVNECTCIIIKSGSVETQFRGAVPSPTATRRSCLQEEESLCIWNDGDGRAVPGRMAG